MKSLFILAAPRTGSTLLYQLLINKFRFFYFSNFTNSFFYRTPFFGSLVNFWIYKNKRVLYKSSYGKTKDLFGPSESSLIFKQWFGGTHPSQNYSKDFFNNMDIKMYFTYKSIYDNLGKMPILTKNAWNCFRVKSLVTLFRESCYFIFLKRDIRKASFSDYKSKIQHNKLYGWNSATPSNYLDLNKFEPYVRSIEQQFEINNFVEKELKSLCDKNNFLEVWYEDLFQKPSFFFKQLKNFCLKITSEKSKILDDFNESNSKIEDFTYEKICNYVDLNKNRLIKNIYQ